MTRLVDDRGCSMIGMPADFGKSERAACRRSCTTCRACRMSVPSLNQSRMADSPFTDLERSTSSPGVPLSDCSIGMVINSSTSAEVMPMPSV